MNTKLRLQINLKKWAFKNNNYSSKLTSNQSNCVYVSWPTVRKVGHRCQLWASAIDQSTNKKKVNQFSVWMNVMRGKSWTKDSLLKTVTKGNLDIWFKLASGKRHNTMGTVLVLSKHWSQTDRLEHVLGKGEHLSLLNKRLTGQQISPGLEITETLHLRPPVGLFVRLREGQSAAADRCVCRRFRRGSHVEVRHRFLCSVPTEGRHGDQDGLSKIDLYSPRTLEQATPELVKLNNHIFRSFYAVLLNW